MLAAVCQPCRDTRYKRFILHSAAMREIVDTALDLRAANTETVRKKLGPGNLVMRVLEDRDVVPRHVRLERLRLKLCCYVGDVYSSNIRNMYPDDNNKNRYNVDKVSIGSGILILLLGDIYFEIGAELNFQSLNSDI